ncbi:unnamed protein product [Soboliphyme baturini]|uniref:BTB domain-containing protein n=1 Tax=Soboliphyme baturini TaxID=241478 RepID=A0A183J0U8_9BILA|nr:unnamed protein product [Soboliphyme baturini]
MFLCVRGSSLSVVVPADRQRFVSTLASELVPQPLMNCGKMNFSFVLVALSVSDPELEAESFESSRVESNRVMLSMVDESSFEADRHCKSGSSGSGGDGDSSSANGYCDVSDQYDEDRMIESKDSSTSLHFVDPDYKDTLLTRLSTLRRNRELCDVILFVGGRELYAHRVVLAAVSSTLYELLTSSTVSSGSSTSVNAFDVANRCSFPDFFRKIKVGSFSANTYNKERQYYLEFPDVDTESFEALIHFAYGGRVEALIPLNVLMVQVMAHYKAKFVNQKERQLYTGTRVYFLERKLNFYLDSLNDENSRLRVPRKKVADVFKLSSLLRMDSCAKASADFLVQDLNVSNCIGKFCLLYVNRSLVAHYLHLNCCANLL